MVVNIEVPFASFELPVPFSLLVRDSALHFSFRVAGLWELPIVSLRTIHASGL